MRTIGILLFGALFLFSDFRPQNVGSAHAAESGFGVYLLGSRGLGAGIVPPPGFYFASESFFYTGTYRGLIGGSDGGTVEGTIEVDLAFDLLTPVWVTPHKIAGGQFGVSATLPVGYVGVGIDTADASTWDSRVAIGDPLVSAFLGWHRGELHWNVVASAYIPAGEYDGSRPANLSLNRPALDVAATSTWLSNAHALDVTASAGITLNGENAVTNYQSGTELHFEAAVAKKIAKGLSIGAVGYHYEQISGDKGAGAVLGSFKGRASALGAVLSYDFTAGGLAVSARLQVMQEFNVKNRFEGAPVVVNVVAWSAP
jgi:hypothetical protein